MEDSLKGFLVSATLIMMFITAVLSFIVIFPQEQGVSFTDSRSNSTYLVVEGQTEQNLTTTLDTIDNNSKTGFNNWDITQGYMGSNNLKQVSSKSTQDYKTSIFSVLLIIATQLFGSNSPIVWAIRVLLALAGTYLLYLVIKNVRTGL